MNVQSNPVAMTLEKVEDDLLGVLRTTEASVGSLVKGFRALTAYSEAILQLASSIVSCVEGDQVAAVLPQVGALGAIAKLYVRDRLQATSGILETVSDEVELLRQLTKVTEGQAKIALRIKVLNIYTSIEVARLGEVGAGFDYLARELADFSQTLAQNTDQLGRQTSERRAATERTRQMLATELPGLRQELTRVERSLEEDLVVLDAGIVSLAKAPALFHDSAKLLDQQIVGVVMAVQGHDITRQQIEHVCEGARIVRGLLSEAPEGESFREGKTVNAYAGLAVQVAQLKAIQQTIAEWTSHIGTCIECILTISATELVEIGPQVRAQEQSLIAHLASIESLEQECESTSGKIHDTLEGIANLSQLVTEHMKKSESARSRLQLLTFNSIVEATRLGSMADTICVIADDIGGVAGEWSKLTEKSGSALAGILRLSSEIGTVMSAFSDAGSQRLKEAQTRTRSGLDGLRDAAAFSVTQGEKIGAIAAAMRHECEQVREYAAELESCFARIGFDATELDGIKGQMLATDPEIGERFDGAEIEKMYAASYTTETERNVLRATIYGAAAVEDVTCAVGGEIELF